MTRLTEGGGEVNAVPTNHQIDFSRSGTTEDKAIAEKEMWRPPVEQEGSQKRPLTKDTLRLGGCHRSGCF